MGSEQEPPEGGDPKSGKTEPVEPAEGEERPSHGSPEEDEPAQYPSSGSMEFQDAATAKPRPATPAELRAREKFAKKQREIEETRLEAIAKQRRQRRILMGAAATVGVVGVVAGLGYWALSTPNVTAQCVQDDPNGQPLIVPDSYCTGHTAGLNGFFFFGGHQYRYYYGSSGSVGSRPIGGTITAPKGANITTKSGSSIQRGGLGGKLGGGKSGGS